ncbi:hypothetical protein SAMN05444128_1915 [Pontibacter indicus]|uniref:YcxB-like protein n=2 Tax=Pontibacter indicus TaxID=1317125 RepID=A0A1R3XDL8_9BACT|nr:hypothetical protein SAMN05444128_1915 [Pontibacter indicus]
MQSSAAPNAIRTKKYQLEKNVFTGIALGKVWRKDWWMALIPFALFMLPAVFSFSWWWVAGAILVTLIFVLLRSAQVMGVTQMEQGNPLFEKLSYEIDSRQILLKRNDREGMALTWDMIGSVERKGEAYLLWLKPPTDAQLPGGWRGWLAKNFQAPVFVMLPFRIFNNPNDIKLLESMLRRKELIA